MNERSIRHRCLTLSVLALVSLCCSERSGPATPPPAIGESVSFSGRVAVSQVIQGGHRFTAGPQGVWFRLGEHPDAKYHYFVTSQDEAEQIGVLERHDDGARRFVDLTGLRVEGDAVVRTEATRDVTSLRVVKE